MTRTTPFRRITLHFTQILRTDGLTFIENPFYFVLYTILPRARS